MAGKNSISESYTDPHPCCIFVQNISVETKGLWCEQISNIFIVILNITLICWSGTIVTTYNGRQAYGVRSCLFWKMNRQIRCSVSYITCSSKFGIIKTYAKAIEEDLDAPNPAAIGYFKYAINGLVQ